ncbi:MAG: diaminopimelate decarboxylase [Actinobacteria bacterium]|nr:diaminopimelate decarboxylase [Actinomycetota bacterium]
MLPPSAVPVEGDLLLGGCSLKTIADRFGTPAYVLDETALRERARRFRDAFTSLHPKTTVCFASKAYPSVSVIGLLVEEGLGSDVVGAGELMMALAAGADPAGIVMHGNAKSDLDIQAALDAGIGRIVVDGFDDIDRIAALATAVTPVLLRVSPGIESATHSALATGGVGAKFGIPVDQVPAAIARIEREPLIRLDGLHAHIGSQIFELDQFEAAVAALATLPRFGVYDLGGGLGVPYVPGDPIVTVERWAERLVRAVHRHLGADVELLVEPGRSLVAPVQVTAYRIVTIKHGVRTHVAVDGGMGDNLEPSLYGQRFAPLVVGKWRGPTQTVELVGRHCESGDVLVSGVDLVEPEVGDLVVVPVTGAYCFTMSNNYNGALKAPVVFCRDGVARLAVRRETYDELLAREVGVGAAD